MSVPTAVQNIRADICSRCPQPCANQQNPAWHATDCAVCPLEHAAYPQRWHTWGACEESTQSPELRGLGDAVAMVAQPIARAIDSALGTNVAGCGGCKARQAALNKVLPFNKSDTETA